MSGTLRRRYSRQVLQYITVEVEDARDFERAEALAELYVTFGEGTFTESDGALVTVTSEDADSDLELDEDDDEWEEDDDEEEVEW